MQAPDSSSRQLKIVQWLVKGTIEAQAAALENKLSGARYHLTPSSVAPWGLPVGVYGPVLGGFPLVCAHT